MGRDVSQLGYTPYYGPDVAAFSPMQQAAFEGTNKMADAFGMPTAQGQYMPAPTEYAGGIQGYSSAPVFEQAQQALQENAPGQYNYLNSFSIDPMTGAQASRGPYGQPVALEMTKPSSGGK